MALTYSITNPIVYPLTSVELTVNGNGVDNVLVVPLASWPFLVPSDTKNTPTSAAVSAAIAPTISFNSATLELTLTWATPGSVSNFVTIAPIFTSF